jgi:hypothetical protein
MGALSNALKIDSSGFCHCSPRIAHRSLEQPSD